MNTRRIIPTVIVVFLPVLAAAQGGGGGSSDLRVSGKLISDLPTGDPPLQVNSTTNVPNLNADKLDGFDVGDFSTAGSGVGVHYKNVVGVPGGEIDQVCAVNTGCFAGDSAGFPVTITEPGSYRLIGNLSVPDATTGAILIEADDVTLDLEGFAIQGPVDCTGEPVTDCSPSGEFTSHSGVRVFGGDNATIRNGTIRGMGFNGLHCNATECTVIDIRAISNAQTGISVSNDGVIRDSIANSNGNIGIVGGTGLIADNLSRANGGYGFSITAIDPNGAVVRGNTSVGNGGNGIACNHCTLVGNVMIENQAFGANFLDQVAYGQNIIRNNDSGTIANAANGVEIDGNLCGSNSTCP